MRVANVSDLRKNLKTYINHIADNSDTLIVNGNGKTVVMISLADYNSLDETSYLLSNRANAKSLKESISSLRKKKVIKKSLKDIGGHVKK
jgi:antitoxin YefM